MHSHFTKFTLDLRKWSRRINMEERKNLVDFSDDEIITLHKDLEKRIMNMEKLTEEEILM